MFYNRDWQATESAREVILTGSQELMHNESTQLVTSHDQRLKVNSVGPNTKTPKITWKFGPSLVRKIQIQLFIPDQ